MELTRYEISIGIFKGVLFGIREYDFEGEDIREKEVVLYLGMFQVVLTLIYNK
tara:strand:+ start:868 stop:1026 length:159 start_codon:yes stop_codon:yes gene_type:complete